MSEWIDLKDGLVRLCLPTLLKDKTTRKNIVLATDSYEDRGRACRADMAITPALLEDMDLKPRIMKSQAEQEARTRKRAEVFTPAWLCCRMNNHLDEEWFGRGEVFNRLSGEHWENTAGRIEFDRRRTWRKYVDSRRIEITCGEAPYVVSRYDAATGQAIEIKDRIGILDRKLRVVNENAEDRGEWLKWALRAFQSVYGYEWQGDSLLIARINLLMTFIEYYRDRWGTAPLEGEAARVLSKVANVISWNFWQMDGLTGTLPQGLPREAPEAPRQLTFFDMGWDVGPQPALPAPIEAGGGQIPCRIRDWRGCRTMTYNSLKRG